MRTIDLARVLTKELIPNQFELPAMYFTDNDGYQKMHTPTFLRSWPKSRLLAMIVTIMVRRRMSVRETLQRTSLWWVSGRDYCLFLEIVAVRAAHMFPIDAKLLIGDFPLNPIIPLGTKQEKLLLCLEALMTAVELSHGGDAKRNLSYLTSKH